MHSLQNARKLKGFDIIEGSRPDLKTGPTFTASHQQRVGGANPESRTDGAPPELISRIVEGETTAPPESLTRELLEIQTTRAECAVKQLERATQAARATARMLAFELARSGTLRMHRACAIREPISSDNLETRTQCACDTLSAIARAFPQPRDCTIHITFEDNPAESHAATPAAENEAIANAIEFVNIERSLARTVTRAKKIEGAADKIIAHGISLCPTT